MYQELGLLCVLLLPVLLIYLYRSESLETSNNPLESVAKKSKKKKKKSKGKASSNDKPNDVSSTPSPIEKPESSKSSTRIDEKPRKVEMVSNDDAPSRREKTGKPGNQQAESSPKTVKQPTTEETVTQKTEQQTGKQQAESAEVDRHMDLTPRYSRVMRITTEKEDDDWEPVPYEEGWESIGSSKKPIYSAPRETEPLSKKQRENQAKAAKKKQAKASADAIQAERLRRHQKELERQKINEFYSTGAGKNTPWGKKPQKGSSKVPTSKASLNEFGQLIWD